MNRRLFGAFGVLAAAAFTVGSCKSDPLSNLDGNPAALTTDFSYLEVNVGAALPITATVYDARSTPLDVPVTFSACNGVVSVAPDTSFHPIPATASRTLVRGVSFGTSCVVASAAGLTDTVQIATFPASLTVSGPDTLGSGDTATYTFQFLDANGAPVAGVPAPTFSSADSTKVKHVAGGTFTALAPGAVNISANGTGSPAGGVTGTKNVTVVAGTFTGGISPTSGSPSDTVTLTNAVGGPGFDADTRVTFNGVRAFTFAVTANSMKAIVPGIGTAGSVVVGMTNMGPGQLAQNGTFTSNTATFADQNDATNDDPTTAPIITANGDYYAVLSGTCPNGVGSGSMDCDDFFRVKNNGASGAAVHVNIAWFTAADVDEYGLDPTLDFCTFDGGCAGATGANPENFTMTVPAGATWVIYLNLFAAGGAPSTLVRVRVTGLP